MSLVLRKERGGKGLLFPQELVLNYWLRENYFLYSRHTNQQILYQHLSLPKTMVLNLPYILQRQVY